MVLSELFTNAVVHTDSGQSGGLVVVEVRRWQLGVRIALTDQGSPTEPVICAPGPAGEPPERGHGLYLANQLAGHLDWHDDVSGRTVRAILGRLPPGHQCRYPSISYSGHNMIDI